MIYGMELNAKKTETMVITKKQETNIPTCNLTVNGLPLRQVNKFKYLGTMINWDARDEIDLNTRTAQAKASFQQIKTVLCNKNISFKTRYRVLKCYIQYIRFFTTTAKAGIFQIEWLVKSTVLKCGASEECNEFRGWLEKPMKLFYIK